MKKIVSVLLVLAMVLAMVPFSAFAAENESEVATQATAVTCSSCGSLCTYSRSYTSNSFQVIVYSCPLTSEHFHYHTRFYTVKEYTCNSCGGKETTQTLFADRCNVTHELIYY